VDFQTTLQDFVKKKKYSELIFFIQTKIPEKEKNSAIFNLLGTARLLKSKEEKGKDKIEGIFLAIEDFRSAHLKEKNTQGSLKGLQNFINASVFLFDKLMRQSSDNPDVVRLLKEASNYYENNKNVYDGDIPTVLAVIKLYKRFTNPKKIKFYYDWLVERKFFDTKSILSYIYYNCYFDEWTQNDFYKNIKILDESIIKYSDKKLKPLITNNRVANKKIKVGFFSSDLNRNHSVSYFLKSILNNYDKNLYEVCLYFNHKKSSEGKIIHDTKNLVDKYRHLFELSDVEAINLIRADKIDIFIDLMGITSESRLQLVKNRVAPIQISWCGYCNTTGIKEMDYIIADQNLVHESEKKLYHEKILFLPEIWNCHPGFNFKRTLKILPDIDNNTVVFGSFNNFNKINQTVINTWCSILKRIKNSKLILKSSSARISDELLKKFEDQDLLNSVELKNWTSNFEDHIKLYNEIDIALDTFPYNGVTTTFESLWMGVPVLTMTGYNFNSRCGSSIINNLNISELVAKNENDYISIAVKLASDKKEMLDLRKKIFNNIPDSPLFDQKKFTSNFFDLIKNLDYFKT
jgi:predicted O-linked N-acetylglucosamine transferase (SPINDLY family)